MEDCNIYRDALLFLVLAVALVIGWGVFLNWVLDSSTLFVQRHPHLKWRIMAVQLRSTRSCAKWQIMVERLGISRSQMARQGRLHSE